MSGFLWSIPTNSWDLVSCKRAGFISVVFLFIVGQTMVENSLRLDYMIESLKAFFWFCCWLWPCYSSAIPLGIKNDWSTLGFLTPYNLVWNKILLAILSISGSISKGFEPSYLKLTYTRTHKNLEPKLFFFSENLRT